MKRRERNFIEKMREWIEKIMNNQNWSTNQVSNELLAWIRKKFLFLSLTRRERERKKEWERERDRERVSGKENEGERESILDAEYNSSKYIQNRTFRWSN